MRRRRAAKNPKAVSADIPADLTRLTRADLIGVISSLQADIAVASEKPTHAQVMLVNGSVRSGQTVVFGEGDIIVVGSVGSGAEIAAGGSIHVYGALRGKAYAGTAGREGARIFCQRLEAELLGIGGVCRLSDDLDDKLRGSPAHAWLESNQMALAGLSSAPEEAKTYTEDQEPTAHPQDPGWLAWVRRLIVGPSGHQPACR